MQAGNCLTYIIAQSGARRQSTYFTLFLFLCSSVNATAPKLAKIGKKFDGISEYTVLLKALPGKGGAALNLDALGDFSSQRDARTADRNNDAAPAGIQDLDLRPLHQSQRLRKHMLRVVEKTPLDRLPCVHGRGTQ